MILLCWMVVRSTFDIGLFSCHGHGFVQGGQIVGFGDECGNRLLNYSVVFLFRIVLRSNTESCSLVVYIIRLLRKHLNHFMRNGAKLLTVL